MDWTTPHWSWWRRLEEHWRTAPRATTMRNRTVPPPPYHRDLLALSAALGTEGRYELAVIVAQMACEVLSEQTLTPLLKGGKARNFNVHGTDTLKLYTKLTRDPIDNQTFWSDYGTHAVRRHEVVHRGRRVSSAEARESVSVATQFVDHVETVGKRLGVL